MESHVSLKRKYPTAGNDPHKILTRLEVKPLAEWTEVDRKAWEEAHKTLENLYHWGHFDVNTPEHKEWEFWPIKELIDREDSHSENPGVIEFKRQIRSLRGQWGAERVFERHQLLGIIVIILLLGGIGYGAFIAYTLWVHSFDEKNCFCFLAGPIYYITLVIVAFLLFGQPGYLSRFIWAVFLLPIFGVLHLYIFDPYLSFVGKTQRILNLYNANETDPSKHIFTPQQKRLAEIEALSKISTGHGQPPGGFQRLTSNSEATSSEIII